MNSEIDNYFAEGCGRCKYGGTPECKVHSWITEMEQIREIFLDCGLTEQLKWNVPCYTFQNANIALVSAFKDYCAISFFKGSLLTDIDGVLKAPGEYSQATRLIKIVSTQEVEELETTIRALIFEAVDVEKAGLTVEFKKQPEPIPEELQEKLNDDMVFKTAFDGLTPGRQRGYIIYFSQPKQAKTRRSRIEKCTANILNGKGLNDDYLTMKKIGKV